MADARSLALGGDADIGGPSLLARRLSAFWRKSGRFARRLTGRRPIEGFVDGIVAGDVRGWAFDPNKPNRRVHVVARCDGQVIGEALADLSRRDLIQEGRGDGRHAFNLKLPAALLDGTVRRIRIEAVSGLSRTRLIGGDLVLGAARDGDRSSAGLSRTATAPARQGAAVEGRTRAALLVWGDGSGVEASLRDWAAQDWPELAVARLGDPAPGIGADATFGPDDAERLRTFAGSTHTLILVRAGDGIDPRLARAAVQTRPLGDVLTWTTSDGAGRRPEARALGVLVGESLGGAFAVRRHVLEAAPAHVLQRLCAGQTRGLETWTASQATLRWTHLPAALTVRPAESSGVAAPEPSDVETLDGFAWLLAGGVRPGRLTPARRADRITLAVWPQAGTSHHPAIDALLADAPAAEIEILSLAESGADQVDRWRDLSGPAARDRLTVRAVDPPGSDGAGAWLSALGAAATGEAVVFCHADVRSVSAGALADLSAWSLSPLVGAATLELRGAGALPLAGLALARSGPGWSLASGYDPTGIGRARPVLAAPAEFMVVSRAKLAACGGVDDRRFPSDGADFDLALRLRRAGGASLLLGWTAQMADGLTPRAGGGALAGFDAAELAAAADAYPDRTNDEA